jgi:NAD(P)-dependent dehydrogenase (short-subunit alcohol dehydrogenase family)
MSLPASISAGLFDVRGKSAIVVGATGAFGKVACATLGAAGARLTIAAGNAGGFGTLAAELGREAN